MRDSLGYEERLARAIEIFDGGPSEGPDSSVEPASGLSGFPASHVARPAIHIWWVNQGHTFDPARKSGHIFAPIEDKLGRQPVHWRTVADVEVGDILVHCAGGQIRALGRATSNPIAASRPVETTDPSVPVWKQMGRRVDVEYFDLAPPIAVRAVANRVRDLSIPQGPFSVDGGLKQGYLFRFSVAGLKILHDASMSAWPTWAETVLHAAPADEGVSGVSAEVEAIRFAALLGNLQLEGLHFSVEFISNYLLALQTKRFAILTGISGTGKTQLALAVARQFRQHVDMREATLESLNAYPITVQRDALKHRRVILPVALTSRLVLPPPGQDPNDRQIRVLYPLGEKQLTLYRSRDGKVSILLLREELREWFLNTFAVGDRFFIEPLETGTESTSSIRIIVPEKRHRLLNNYIVAAVKPDWSDNRGLLGYFNPLISSYVITPFLRLLLDARDEVERAERDGREPAPFFVILDEMNLARVEHYFSDFLSALESGEPIHLHDHPGIELGETEDAVPVPRQLPVPKNVFFTGTVNVDETTYMFSPKVLDRAFTIELNRVDLATFGAEHDGLDDLESTLFLSRFPGSLGPTRKPSVADWVNFGDLLDGNLRQVVRDLHDLLAEDDRHFGYRVANEIARFVVLANEQTDGSDEALWAALDLAVLEKILPKFHGTQQELEEVLTRLSEFVELRPLPRTAAKLQSMQRRLRQQGFTSFIV